ncbi:MAG: GvpL/GvpF family gas vesicle protein [Bacillota bacterium]
MSKTLYLYGLVDGFPRLPSMEGVRKSCLEALVYQDITLVASEIEDPKALNTDDAYVHAQVLAEIFTRHTVLPFRFGVVTPSCSAAMRLLRTNAGAIRDEFSRLAGKGEIGIKVFWKREAARRQIQKEIQRYELLSSGVPAVTPEEQRQMALEIGQMVESIVAGWKNDYLSVVARRLSEKAEDVRSGNLYGVQMLFNCSYLMDLKREPDFRRTTELLASKYDEVFEFKYSGPFPPYSFVELELSWEGEQDE